MFGLPGSGKGTQAVRLAEYFNVPHISTGDMFRDIRKEDTSLGKMVKELSDAGTLIPDDVTGQVLQNRLEKDDCKNGFILDGYPRNLDQAEFLETLADIDKVISIDVSDKEATKRITARRICEDCNTNFNILYLKPKQENVCDECGGKLVQRPDSVPEVVEKRLKIYHEQTEPVEGYYQKKGILAIVDGERALETVFRDIIEKIDQ